MSRWLLHCRAGFENECAAEIRAHALEHGVSGYCKARQDSGYVIFTAHEPGVDLFSLVTLEALIFARQWFAVYDLLNDLPLADRILPVIKLLKQHGLRYADTHLETPDTNTGKELQKLCRALHKPLQAALERHELYDQASVFRLHLCFLSTHAAYIGFASRNNSSPWLMGIPRLHFPRQAPSRSTLKLEEALLRLLSEEERRSELQSGMRAVDLGAAPGGWTWQLVRRRLSVIAVDNGSMQPELLDSGLVEHIREDGFRYQPKKPVDWMVCDIVDKPKKVAALAARWLISGWCRRTIFNLKLPMKKRYQEVQECLDLLERELAEAGIAASIRCKQLYHDREEVTVCVLVADAAGN